MAVLIDTTTNATALGVSSLTYSLTVAANSFRGLHVGVGIYQTGLETVTGITYNSVAMTQTWGHSSGATNIRTDGWHLIAPSTGTHNVAITLSGSAIEVSSGAISLYNCDQSTLTSSPQTADDTSITVTSTSGDLVITNYVDTNAGDLATYNGTLQWQNGAVGDYAGFTQPGAASVTQTITTGGSSNYVLGGANFKQVSFTYSLTLDGGVFELVGGDMLLYVTPNMKYSISGNTITFAEGNEPQPGDILIADYRYDP